MFRVLFSILSLLIGVAGQGGIGPGGATGSSVTFMNSLRTQIDGNYVIGYLDLPATGNTGAGVTTPSTICKQVSMFKFPSSATGDATTLSLYITPPKQAETCSMTLTLNSQTTGTIGTAITSTYMQVAPSMPINPIQSTVPFTFDLRGKGWSFVNGQQYYIGFRTGSWTSDSRRYCNVTLPWGPASVPQWAVVTQNGPPGQLCGATPLTTDRIRDGAALLMTIGGNPLQSPYPSAMPTKSVNPSAQRTVQSVYPSPSIKSSSVPTAYPSRSGSSAPSSTSAPSGSSASSSTSAPSGSSSSSLIVSASSGPIISQSTSTTQSASIVRSPASSITASPKVSYGLNETSGIYGINQQSDVPVGSNLSTPRLTATIALSILGAVVVVGAIGAFIHKFNKKPTLMNRRPPTQTVMNPLGISQGSPTNSSRLSISMSRNKDFVIFEPIPSRV